MSRVRFPVSWRRMLIVTGDAVAVFSAFILAFLLRFDFSPGPQYVQDMVQTFPHVMASYMITGIIFGLYSGIYYYSSFSDLIRITKAIAAAAFISAALILFTRQGLYPRSILLLHPILAFFGICWIRFAIRLVKTRLKYRDAPFREGTNVLLVGAGELGESLLRQITKTPEMGYNVVGFIDDDRAKWGMMVHDCPVLGGRAALGDILEKYAVDEIIIAIATQRGEITRALVESLRGIDPRPVLKTAPALDEMLRPASQGVSLRSVKPTDLLNRSVLKIDGPKIARILERKRVLVTGAGGSIGSELCRQALKYNPEKIILIENHATSLFYRESELRAKALGTAIVGMLGDVRDHGFLERVFKEHTPHVVLHAAAHKHVHQLEFNIPEGISNNVMGTYHAARAAHDHGAEIFLLISTDKAVNPSSVMGATKRAAERVITNISRESRTKFVAVRFGNVLGSSGSVLKIFQDQITKGGPITVTDERVTRYFMTVEESIGLVLQAVSMARGGEIFVLKMGTPVRIMDMAKNLILLSGLEVGKDIEIVVTGLKQGEKMNEELVEKPQGVADSEHPDIHLLEDENGFEEDLDARLSELEVLCRGTDLTAMMRKLQKIVPTFKPAEAHNISD